MRWGMICIMKKLKKHISAFLLVFMIAGIFPVVPGAQIYWATYYLVTDQIYAAFDSGFLALKIMISIVLGIVVVFEIPYKFFQVRRR